MVFFRFKAGPRKNKRGEECNGFIKCSTHMKNMDGEYENGTGPFSRDCVGYQLYDGPANCKCPFYYYPKAPGTLAFGSSDNASRKRTAADPEEEAPPAKRAKRETTPELPDLEVAQISQKAKHRAAKRRRRVRPTCVPRLETESISPAVTPERELSPPLLQRRNAHIFTAREVMEMGDLHRKYKQIKLRIDENEATLQELLKVANGVYEHTSEILKALGPGIEWLSDSD